jgi:hypothetical protein
MANSGESPQLDYAPKPPVLRRSRAYRGVIAVAIILTAYFGQHWPYQVWHHVHLHMLEQQCVQNPIPSGVVVYSSDNPSAAIASPHAATLYAATRSDYPWGTAIPGGTHATVFAGKVSRGYGNSEFITIEAYASYSLLPDERDAQIQLVVNEFSPDLTNRSIYGPSISLGTRAHPVPKPPRPEVLVYSATRDVSDPSRIHLRYCILDDEYQVDGILAPNGQFGLDIRNTGPR